MKKTVTVLLLLGYLISLPEVKATPQAKDLPIAGAWKIISYQIVGYPAMNEAQAKSWIGKLAEFSSRKKATLRESTSQQQVCLDFSYQVSKQTAEGYFLVGYKVPPNRFGVTQPEVEVINLTCKNDSWLGKGREFVKISEELMLSNWEGVFFFFARQADSLTLLSAQGGSKMLLITPQSVGILTPDSDFNEATLSEALPGYTINKISHLSEDKQEIIDAFEFQRQNKLKLKVYPNPTTPKIGRIEISEETARAPANAKLGVTYADVFKDEQQLVDCQAGIQEKLRGKTLCNFKNMSSLQYIFEPKRDSEGNFSPIEALNQAKLIGFIWTADPSLVMESVNPDNHKATLTVPPVSPPQMAEPKAEAITPPKKVEVATLPKTETTNSTTMAADASTSPGPVPTVPEAAYKLQEEQLKEVFERLKEALKIAGNEGVVEGPVNLTNFINAQNAWIEYREKNCSWQASLKEKKVPDKSFSCLERLTRERVTELKQLLDSISK
jgi:uncharacterized protein YecT (DUF1311 family)